MALSIRNRKTKVGTTVEYNQWINDIVNKGNAHEYEVRETWNLVVVRKKTNGVFKKIEITEIENARNLKQKSPLEYDYVGLNVKAQIQKDINRSAKIKRWRFFFTVKDEIKIIARQIKKPFQNIVLLMWITILLSIASIALMILF